MTDPLEKLVRDGLVRAGLSFKEDSFDTRNLDFMLSDSKIYIEIKQFHSERISEQMSRAPNVIAIQGVEAAKFFAGLLALLEGALCPHRETPMTDARAFGETIVAETEHLLELEAAFLVSLAENNCPPDIAEFLTRGDPKRGVPPRLIQKAIKAVLGQGRNT